MTGPLPPTAARAALRHEARRRHDACAAVLATGLPSRADRYALSACLAAWRRALARLSDAELARLVGELADPLVRDPRGRWHP